MIAHALYGRALEQGEALTGSPLVCRDAAGRALRLPLARWLGPAGAVDERVLDRATGPVLDVGCGPGRHVSSLARRGVLALGVDVSPVAVRLARARGATAIEGSIFDRLPGAGSWGSALLLDGNVGIGGRPATLLRRVAELLAPGGLILLELEPPGTGAGAQRLRLEGDGAVSDWFAWARVAVDALDSPVAAAGLVLRERWCDEGRWFAEVRS
jgi:SAM-dependent methyltransferase